MKNNVVFGMTFSPLAINEAVGGSRVKGVVTYGDVLFLHLGISKEIGPVIEVVNLDALSRDYFGCSFRCRRKGENQKPAVIRDQAVRAMAGPRETGFKRFPRTLPERRMIERVIDLMGILGQAMMKLFKGRTGSSDGRETQSVCCP
jgi:hypothetical protein